MTDVTHSQTTTVIHRTLDQLKQRLLDLSKRNKLINFPSKRSANVVVVDELPAEVFRILSIQKRAMRFKPSARTDVNVDEVGNGLEALPLFLDLPVVEVVQASAAQIDLWLQTSHKPEILDSKLRRLADQARLAIEEQGVNSLFLALGMLTYFEADDSELPLKAPLLLLPVTLERQSAGRPYEVRAGDDDPVLNPALSEKLLQQFGVKLPEVPEVSDTLDPVQFFLDLKSAVADKPRWAVTNEISLGFFSFQKFVMYKDLERNRSLFEKHPLVRLLAERSGKGGFGLPGDVAGMSLDREFTPEDTFQVVDADSSQQRAMAAVARGHSLVLQGPPGTGKSQTITNLIANALASGKTVLFVSEKMAALQVVYGRLQEAGLGEFCLELHSNHSNKRAFLKETQRSLDKTLSLPAEPPSLAGHLQRARASLTEYAQLIHSPIGPLEWTPYHAYGELAALKDAPIIPLGQGADTLSGDTFEDVCRLVGDLAAMSVKLGDPRQHPWRDVGRDYMDTETRRALEAALISTLDACRRFENLATTAVSNIGLKPPEYVGDGQRAAAIAAVLERSPGVPLAVLSDTDWHDAPELARQLIEAGRRYVAGRAIARKRFTQDAFEKDHARGVSVVARHGSQLLRFLNSEYRQVRAEWRAMRLPGYSVSLQQQLIDLKELEATRKLRDYLDEHKVDGERLFGNHWRGPDSDWDVLTAYLGWIEEFRTLCVQHGIGRRVLDHVVHPRPEMQVLRQLAQAAEQVELERLNLSSILQWPRGYLAQASVSAFARRVNELHTAEGGFDDLRAYNATVEKVKVTAAAPTATRLADGTLPADQAVVAFRRAFLEKWLDRAIAARPTLRDFSPMTHEARLTEFRQLDRRVLDDNRTRIQRIVRNRVQEQLHALAESAAMRHLRAQMAKGRNHASLRTTLRISYPALQAIKPCFMMSPMTVAQFLEPNLHHFDLVIFDEASQLTAEDAIGAVLRGDQLAVVGDPKQLPPTNFFAVQSGQVEAVTNEEGDLSVEDFESILEQFQASGAPTARLRWHYRSRHESLIAFSNATYYEQDLLTFPSADTDCTERGLQFEFIADGVYEGNGVNPVEARRVAEAVIDHARRTPNLSLGVGTFNLRQQLLIQDELERLRRENPDVEPFFIPKPDGGFFVKNLENIQGDDRDVIFLSVTYAKGPDGRLRHNFGPINGQNGWRRLNVLVTRSRLRLRVFASMRGDEIDLTKTNSQGARDLREFLLFAERGKLTSVTINASAATDSAFEDDVRRALAERGYRLVPQVGVAGYRIDFGVLDDTVAGRFVCGIECDGASYHSAETARDRDRLRQEVLEGLGWQLVRVWSTDWFKDRVGALRRLTNAIEACRQRAREGTDIPGRVAGNQEARPAIGQVIETRVEGEEPGSVMMERSLNGAGLQLIKELPNGAKRERYQKAQLQPARLLGVLSTPDSELLSLMAEVVNVEGPVHIDDAYSRIATAVGDGRTGQRITARLDQIARRGQRSGLWIYRNDFLYHNGGRIRVRNRADASIPGERVAPEEYQLAAREYLALRGPCSPEDLAVGIRTLLGFNRTGHKIQLCIDQAVERLLAEGVIGQAAQGLGLREEG